MYTYHKTTETSSLKRCCHRSRVPQFLRPQGCCNRDVRPIHQLGRRPTLRGGLHATTTSPSSAAATVDIIYDGSPSHSRHPCCIIRTHANTAFAHRPKPTKRQRRRSSKKIDKWVFLIYSGCCSIFARALRTHRDDSHRTSRPARANRCAFDSTSSDCPFISTRTSIHHAADYDYARIRFRFGIRYFGLTECGSGRVVTSRSTIFASRISLTTKYYSARTHNV